LNDEEIQKLRLIIRTIRFDQLKSKEMRNEKRRKEEKKKRNKKLIINRKLTCLEELLKESSTQFI
jgi:hypothetical protein